MAHFFKNKIIKTRKPHVCWGCRREFKVGSDLRVVEAVDHGDFSRAYWCHVCEDVMSDWSHMECEELIPGEVKGADPEHWEEVRSDIEDVASEPCC